MANLIEMKYQDQCYRRPESQGGTWLLARHMRVEEVC